MRYIILILSILFLNLLNGMGMASETNDPEPIPIQELYSNIGRVHRDSTVIPIECFYESYLNTIVVSFKRSIGEVTVVLENMATGETQSCFLDSEYGTQLINIYGGNGYYSITFTLSGGEQYYGEFEII